MKLFGKEMGWVAIAFAGALVCSQASYSEDQQASAAAVGDKMDVGMEYSLTVDGQVVDSTEGKDAFHYVHGQGQILEGLENQLKGMHIGDSKEVSLTAQEGYGPVDPEAFVEISKERLPKDVQPQVGMILQGVNPETNNLFQAKISEIKENSVILDLNHPLAGKDLKFKVKIQSLAPVAAQPAPAAADSKPSPAAEPAQPAG